MSDMICNDFKITVDALVVKNKKLLLMKRNTQPFIGEWALPGGIVDSNELLEEAVKRETKEETGINVQPIKRVGVFDALDRDPSRRSITVVYLCEAIGGKITENSEAQDIKWFQLNELPELAFDHAKIIKDCLDQ